MSVEPEAVKGPVDFVDSDIPGSEYFRDAALQLAATMGGMMGLLTERHRRSTTNADTASPHLDESQLTPGARDHVPAATFIVNSILRGIQAQMREGQA